MIRSEADRSGTERAVQSVVRGSARAGIAAVAGAGLVAGLFSATVAGLLHQAKVAATLIETSALDAALVEGLLSPDDLPGQAAALPVPCGDSIYLSDGARVLPGAYSGPRPLTLAMLGDSTAVGYGCRSADELPGVQLARAVAGGRRWPVRLVTRGLVGCGAADLGRQIGETLPDGPDLVVIVIGGNDIRDKVPPWQSARQLGDAVAVLRAQHIPVVVGTCPDFGVLVSIPQPLRSVLHTWSQRLAARQEKEVAAAGGLPVPIGRLVSPEFVNRPDLFAADRFHPSGAGYARAVAALAPVVLGALRAADNRASAGRFDVGRGSHAG